MLCCWSHSHYPRIAAVSEPLRFLHVAQVCALREVQGNTSSDRLVLPEPGGLAEEQQLTPIRLLPGDDVASLEMDGA